MKSDELLQHILFTYFIQRLGMAALALIFPFVLWLGGNFQELPLQNSMSAYYHAGEPAGLMRDWFVAFLCVIGVFLYLYKGFSNKENIALNIAGACAVGVAMIPMTWDCDPCPDFTLHGFCAVTLFLCLAYVCIWRAKDTLHLMKNQKLAEYFKWIYKLLGIAMIVLPLTSFLLSYGAGNQENVFFVEASGVWVFSVYWWMKSYELNHHFESRVITEQLEI